MRKARELRSGTRRARSGRPGGGREPRARSRRATPSREPSRGASPAGARAARSPSSTARMTGASRSRSRPENAVQHEDQAVALEVVLLPAVRPARGRSRGGRSAAGSTTIRTAAEPRAPAQLEILLVEEELLREAAELAEEIGADRERRPARVRDVADGGDRVDRVAVAARPGEPAHVHDVAARVQRVRRGEQARAAPARRRSTRPRAAARAPPRRPGCATVSGLRNTSTSPSAAAAPRLQPAPKPRSSESITRARVAAASISGPRSPLFTTIVSAPRERVEAAGRGLRRC